TRERNWLLGKQQEMSLVISLMKNMERASVLIDTQNQAGLIGAPLKTASVSAQAIGGAPLDDDQIDNIRYYVSGAIAGLKPENVTISDANGTIHVGDPEKGGGPGGDNPYSRAQKAAERDLNDKVRKLLSYIPNLTVTSTVTLDHDKNSRSVEIKNDPKPVPVR